LGARWGDVRRLRVKQSTFTNDALRVRFRVMKNRRHPSKRLTIVHHQQLVAESDLQRFPPGLREGPSVFAYVSMNEVNEILRLVSAAAWVNPPVTSYSFRHNFIARVRAFCEQSGEDLADYTGHFGDAMLKSHYSE